MTGCRINARSCPASIHTRRAARGPNLYQRLQTGAMIPPALSGGGMRVKLLPRLGRCVRLAGLAAAMLLGGCLPQSREPIAPASEAASEPRLAGLWVGQNEGEPLYVHVLLRDQGMMDVLTVSHERSGGGDWDLYEAYVTSAGGRRFLNLQPSGVGGANETDTPEPYFFAAYEFFGRDRLQIRFLRTETLAAAIAAGRLTGRVTEDSTGRSVQLTGSAAEIHGFLANASPRNLLDPPIEFRRIEPPPA